MTAEKPKTSQVKPEASATKKKRTRKKYLTLDQFIGLSLVLLVIIGLVAGIYLSFQTQQYGSKAAPGNTTLSIIPQTQSVQLGQSGSANVFINPNNEQVMAVQLIMTYDPAILTINDIRPGSFFTSQASEVGDPLVISKNLSQPGKIVYALSFPLRQSPTDPVNFSTAPGEAAIIDFTVSGSGSSSFNFVVDQVVKTTVNDINANQVLGSVTPGQVTTSTVSSGTRLFIDTKGQNTLSVGQTITYDILFDTGNQDIIGVDAVLTIPNTKYDVVSIQNGTVFDSYPESSYEPSTNTLIMSGSTGTDPLQVVRGNGLKLGSITLRAKQSGPGDLNFQFAEGNRNDSNMVIVPQSGQDPVDVLAQASGAQITIQPAATTTPTPTNTPTTTPKPSTLPSMTPGHQGTPPPTPTPRLTPTPFPTASPTATPTTVNLNIQMNFQGKSRAEADKTMDVRISFYDILTQTVTVKEGQTNEIGILNTSIASGNYIMLVEAEGYLSRVYGNSSSPVAIPTGNINVTVDISDTPLLGGDFNGDGEVNEIDYTLYFLTRFKTPDQLVDLDESGEVNNLDFAIIRSNWGLQAQVLPE